MEQPLGFGLVFGARPAGVFDAPGDIGVGPQARFVPGGGRCVSGEGQEQARQEDRSREARAQLFSGAAPSNRERKRKRNRPARRFRAWPRGRNANTGSLR